jgi:SAM-dependent methyltransferase
VLFDLNRAMLVSGDARDRVAGDMHALPFDAARFDTVIANNVLEHAYDPVECLREIARVLRPGGALYAFIPMDGLSSEHALPTHLWKADRISVRLALAAAGLSIAGDELVDLAALGVPGAFPQCDGLVLAVRAGRKD